MMSTNFIQGATVSAGSILKPKSHPVDGRRTNLKLFGNIAIGKTLPE